MTGTKTIKIQTPDGQLELEVTPALAARVASHNSITIDAVSDVMILQFFREASNTAFQKAAREYLVSDGTNT
jgi:hypothetical protein